MKDLEHAIYMRLVIEDKSMSEIQSEFSEYSERTIIRKVNELHNQGKIEHDRIHGKGKRKRYFVKEENTKQNLTIRAFDEVSLKKRIYKEVHPPITQRFLSAHITDRIKRYNKEFKELKKLRIDKFYIEHIVHISDCLEWINRLKFAITSGMLGNSPNKLALAQRNMERYEEFLGKLIYNMKDRDEKTGNEVIKAVYDELVSVWFMERILMTPRPA